MGTACKCFNALGVSFHSGLVATDLQLLKLCATSVHSSRVHVNIDLWASMLLDSFRNKHQPISSLSRGFGSNCSCMGCYKVGAVDPELVPEMLTNSIMHVCAHVVGGCKFACQYLDRMQVWTVMALVAQLLSNCACSTCYRPLNFYLVSCL